MGGPLSLNLRAVPDAWVWPYEEAGLILLGAQETNSVIAKLADRLPMLLAARKAWLALTTYLDTKGDISSVCEGANKKQRLSVLYRPPA